MVNQTCHEACLSRATIGSRGISLRSDEDTRPEECRYEKSGRKCAFRLSVSSAKQ